MITIIMVAILVIAIRNKKLAFEPKYITPLVVFITIYTLALAMDSGSVIALIVLVAFYMAGYTIWLSTGDKTKAQKTVLYRLLIIACLSGALIGAISFYIALPR